ncbi:MAG TPA: hypothetical protein VKA15_02860 [Isosphaeraceae bacterium]|nr:hypothetical protein [Isosphaeraceae bacterium]
MAIETRSKIKALERGDLFFRELHMEKSERTIKPLVRGTWH